MELHDYLQRGEEYSRTHLMSSFARSLEDIRVRKMRTSEARRSITLSFHPYTLPP